MRLIFTPNTKERRQKAVRRTWRFFLLAALILHMLPANRLATHASGPDMPSTQNNFDFSSSSDVGNLDTDGYQWIHSSNTLKLKNINITDTVTLPDEEVTIETTGNCTIDTLAGSGSRNSTKLIFAGTGQLTIEKQINISGGDHLALTVNKNARVVANGGISMGSSGGVNSVVTVNGTLTVKGTAGISAIFAGKVVVKSGGLLNVSGENGVNLNGMNIGSYSAADVFVVERGGCFAANCINFNVKVSSIVTSGFPAGSNAEQAINVPEGYLPVDCGIKLEGAVVNLVRKSTGEVYTGAIMIHENHSWPENFNGKDENGHWRICTYEGCGKTKDYEAHSYDKKTKTCVCGYVFTGELPEDAPDEPSGGGHHSHSGGTATCVSGKICELCGTEYTERDGTVHVHTEIRGKKAAACTSEGYTGDTFCKDCNTKISSGTVIPATGHDWQVTDEEEAAASLAGKRYFTCAKCGETREEAVSRLTPSVIEKDEKAEEKDSEEADKEVVNSDTEVDAEDEILKPEQFRMPWWILLAAFALIIGSCWFFLIWKKKKEEKEEEKEEEEEGQ